MSISDYSTLKLNAFFFSSLSIHENAKRCHAGGLLGQIRFQVSEKQSSCLLSFSKDVVFSSKNFCLLIMMENNLSNEIGNKI